MAEIYNLTDQELIAELTRRLDQKNASIEEVEFMTKKLLSLNEATKDAESIKDRFMSLMRSAFSNPINSLLDLADSLEDKSDLDRFSSTVKKLCLELSRLDFHFKNILAAAEIEEGKIKCVYTPIDFNAVFQSALKTFYRLIAEKNLLVVLKNNDDRDFISDKYKIYMILLNLISNACEYSYPDSKIAVSLKKRENSYEIMVEDSGEGIVALYAAQVYTRFSQFDSGKTRVYPGLGLGLSVARGFTESLDGSIDFQSEEGYTVFRVTLPQIGAVNCANYPIEEIAFDDFKKEALEL
ncbi:MAG: HAMP domain-containing histidine kinase [Helicobacteraceae bacterium]|nr:HAMP domain-containing histidine kinase [Helicobacteraceae bacterium]